MDKEQYNEKEDDAKLEEYISQVCMCGHERRNHANTAGDGQCEVFINEMLGDCECDAFDLV